MRIIKTFTISLFFLCLTSFVLAEETTEVKDFFNRYTELSANFDFAVVKLYSDNALIHSYRRYPHGLERASKMTGAELKKLLVDVIPLAKQKGDINEFSKIAITIDGVKAKIKADRYSVLKCYTDEGYYMVIKRGTKGKYKIIEEYMETQPQSDCLKTSRAEINST